MKTIELDDDVYRHIAAHTQNIGESASSILRRLLGLAEDVDPGTNKRDEVAEILQGAGFMSQRSAVDRFLFLLAELHRRHPSEFARVLQIQGRGRKYFARGRRDIEESGESTQPRPIPDSEYWVMTNSPTPQKARQLQLVAELLGYNREAAQRLAKAVVNK